MKVYVRLYAFLAERASDSLRNEYPEGIRSGSQLALDVPEGSTVEYLVNRLSLPEQQAKLLFVNGRMEESDYRLHPGDEVGIFPPIAGGEGEKAAIQVDVWLYGPLARYGGEAAGKHHANRKVSLPPGSRIGDLLGKLNLPTEERGITFINGNLSAMPGLQPDLDEILNDGDRVAFFHLNSMWPFQYRHGVSMTPGMAREIDKERDGLFHHRK